MKKIINILALSLAVVLASSTLAFADTTSEVSVESMENPFTDVNASTDEGKAIINMAGLGYVSGYENGTFNPNGQITRAELVRIINQVLKYSTQDSFYINNVKNNADFLDNIDNEAWYYNDVKLAQVYGYINGFEDKTFRPKENFTRQQVCVVLSLLAGLDESDIKSEVVVADIVSEWADKYVKMAISQDLFELESGNTFRATQNITRGEVCLALSPFITEKQVIKTEVVTNAQGEVATNAEGSTMTTTVKTVISSGGSSIRKDPTTATTTTNIETTTETTTNKTTNTEATTETTTKSSSVATTKATTEATTEATTRTEATTKVEPTTEVTTEAVTIEANILKSLNRVVRNMNRYVLPACTTDGQTEVVNAIVSSMNNYINDPTYDFSGEASNAMSMYKALPSDEKSVLKNLITSKIALDDLLTLQEEFFPGLI